MLFRFCWLLSACSVFISFNLSAQKPDWIRNTEVPINSYGTTNCKRIAIHPDGSVFVLGQYSGSLTFNGQLLTSPANTFSDVFLAKYNTHGDLIWIKQLFQSTDWYSNSVLDLKVDYEGNLVFSGSCLWPSSILGSVKGIGAFIAKIDTDANLIWLNFLPLTGGSLAEHDTSKRGNRIGFDPDHNILWLTDQINEFAPSGGLAVVKYKSDGTLISNTFVTVNPTFYRPGIQDFSVDKEGNFVISGNFESTVQFKGGPALRNTGSNFNPVQFFVAKFNADGNFAWVVYSNYASNVVTCHTVDPSGNIYVGWQIDAGSVIYTPGGNISPANNQRSIARISPDGKLDWMNPLGLTNVDDIFYASDDLLYVTGASFTNEFRYQSYVRPNQGDAAFILKVNTEGNFYGLYMGEPQDDPAAQFGSSTFGYQSIVDPLGNIYTLGDFWIGQTWGCVSATTQQHSFFLIKHQPVASPLRSVSGPGIVCDGTQVTLTTDLISNGVLYKWFTPDNANPVTGELLKNSIVFTAKEEYHKKPIIVSIKDNCDEYFAAPYILNIPPKPKAPELTTSKATVCPGTSELYKIKEVSDDFIYRWILPHGVSSSALTDAGGVFVFSSDFKQGDLYISSTNFCGSAETTFQISTFKTPAVPALSGNLEICPGIISILKSVQPVDDALSYQWELPGHISFNPYYITDGTTLNALTDVNFQSGEIKVRAVGQCKESDFSPSIIVNRAALPGNIDSVKGPEEICTSDTKLIRYAISPVKNVVSYSWTISDLFDRKGTIKTTDPYIDLKVLSIGETLLEVIGENTCHTTTSVSSLKIISYAPPEEPVLTISECDKEITVSKATDFIWYLNGAIAPQFSDKTLAILDSGVYQVEVENFCGIRKSNIINAYPVIFSKTLIPNVITPNGDGINDFLTIDKSLNRSYINIVNRWGQSVYSSSDYQNKWNADDMSPGNYYLTVENQCLPGGYKGWLSVIK